MLFGSVETFEDFSPPKRRGEGLAEGHPQVKLRLFGGIEMRLSSIQIGVFPTYR